MMTKTHLRILTFIKKYNEELCPSTGIDEFAGVLEECFSFIKQDQSKKEKLNIIMSNLVLDDGSLDKLVEGDLQKYIERLIDFVDGPSDDPLEKNNLKQRSSSGSSDEEDIKGHNKPQNKQKRGRSRSKEKKNKNKKNQKNPSLVTQLQKAFGKDVNIQDLFQSLANHNNRKQQQQQNNKNVVFLQNVPREMRSYSEIEQMLQGRGELAKIQLAGRVPSVQFKNHAEAQALIDKYIVHKGIKIEFTAELNKHSDNHRDKFSKDKETNKVIQPAAPVQTTTSQQQQHPQPAQKQDQKIEEETDQKKSKEEQELNEQIEQLKGQAKSLVVDKIRLALLLVRRKDKYSPQLSQEITELKGILQQKKADIEKMNSVEQLKSEVKWLNENYDYTLVIKIPEQNFRDKNIMKLLHQEFDKFGSIKDLSLKLQTKSAHLSYQNFESAENAYYSTTEQSIFQVEFLNQGIKKVLIAQS